MILNIIGDIDEAMVLHVAEALKDKDEYNDIQVVLCSQGGDTYSGLAILGLLSQFPDVEVSVYGACMSAAFLVLTAGHLRRAHKQAWGMLHEDSGELSGNTTEMHSQALHMKKTDKQYNLILARGDKELAKQYDIKSINHAYLTADEMLELKLVDEVFE